MTETEARERALEALWSTAAAAARTMEASAQAAKRFGEAASEIFNRQA